MTSDPAVVAQRTARRLPLSLIVFAFDEEANARPVLGDILTWLRHGGAPYELIFVDDGSRDRTRDEAAAVFAGDPSARIVRHEHNRGIGAALKTGVAAARLPWVTFLPCDGQIAPRELEALLAIAEQDRVDVVFSVYRDRDDGLDRKIFSAGIRFLMRLFVGVRMQSDGPYLFRRAVFDADRLKPDTFFLNFEFPIRTMRDRRPYQVVAVSCRPRLAGASKSTGWRRVVGVARDLVGLRLRLWQESTGRLWRHRE